MEEYVYRFRPTSALLGEFHELQNREIYLSSLQESTILWRASGKCLGTAMKSCGRI